MNQIPKNEDGSLSEADLEAMKRRATLFLIVAIIIIFIGVAGIYYDYDRSSQLNIFGKTLAAVCLSVIYYTLGNALIFMDKHEKAKRQLHPLPNVPFPVSHNKAIIYTAIAVSIALLIVILSYF